MSKLGFAWLPDSEWIVHEPQDWCQKQDFENEGLRSSSKDGLVFAAYAPDGKRDRNRL